MQLVRYRTIDIACQEGKKRQNASASGRIHTGRGLSRGQKALKCVAVLEAPGILERRSAAPLTARLFLPQAAPRRSCPEKALCNSSHALLHAFSASRLERLLLLGPGGPRSARPVLLRLAGFRKRGLARSAKIGALRQPRLRCLVHRTRSTRLPWSSRVGRESRGGRAGPSKVPPSPSGPSGQRPERTASADPAFC